MLCKDCAVKTAQIFNILCLIMASFHKICDYVSLVHVYYDGKGAYVCFSFTF